MTTNREILISPNGRVFDLPAIVAIDEGLFERAGLSVRFAAGHEQAGPSGRDVFTRLKEALYERGEADVYNICEWASIDRMERGSRGGQIAVLRAAVVAQVIVSFDDSIQETHNLRGVPVAVNELTGSHYTTLQALEGAIPREEIVIEHIGSPAARLEALNAGTVRAAALMEPFVSLALKQGAHVITATFYRGAEVVAPTVERAGQEAYLSAINEAVDLINAHPTRFRAKILEAVEGELAPEELETAFFRYTHVEPFDRGRFAETHAWMESWGLTEAEADPALLVLR